MAREARSRLVFDASISKSRENNSPMMADEPDHMFPHRLMPFQVGLAPRLEGGRTYVDVSVVVALDAGLAGPRTQSYGVAPGLEAATARQTALEDEQRSARVLHRS